MELPPAPRREVGDLILEGVPDIPAALSGRSYQYQQTRSCMLQDWLRSSPSPGLLVSTRFGDVAQLHSVSHPGGDRRQLTFFREPITSASACPAPELHNGLVFLKDIGGSEKYQLYYFDFGTGSSTLLTDGHSRNGGVHWNHAGTGFSFYSTARNGRDWDIRFLELSVGTPAHGRAREEELVTEGGGWWQPREWAPDDRRMLVKKYISAAESELYILDLATKEKNQIGKMAAGSGKIRFGPCCWASNGKGVYFTSNEGGEFQTLKFLDLDHGAITDISKEIRWDVEDLSLNKPGDVLCFTCNEDGVSRMYLLDTATHCYEKHDGAFPMGVISTVSFHPELPFLLGLVINAATTPGDVFTLDIRTPQAPGSLVRWTESEVGGLPQSLFVPPSLIYFDTFDKDPDAVHRGPDGSRRIPAFYYSPRDSPLSKSGRAKAPVLIRIHGGPESQVRPSFDPVNQFLVNEMGIAVLEPNVRGSSGYGTTYLQLDFGKRRLDSLWDIGKLLDWIEQREELDSRRVAVYGGSYGGYMVLNCLIHFGDRLCCGAESVGITNFVTFLNNTEGYRRDLRRQVYGDERDPEMKQFLLSVSPLTSCHKIRKPLLVGQGLNDPRVPVSEAEQLCEAIRRNGQPVRYVLAKNEGHGFHKKPNRDFWFNSVFLFLDQYLLEGELSKL